MLNRRQRQMCIRDRANNTVQGDVSLNSAVARVLRSKAAASQSTTVYQAALREMIRDKMTTIVKAKSDPAKIAETESRGGIVVDFDPYDWEVRSGAQLGDGQLALFVWPKDDDLKVRWGAPTMIRIGAGSDENDKDGLAWYINKHTARESEVARPALIKSLRDQFLSLIHI